jgi:hypothetical protein
VGRGIRLRLGKHTVSDAVRLLARRNAVTTGRSPEKLRDRLTRRLLEPRDWTSQRKTALDVGSSSSELAGPTLPDMPGPQARHPPQLLGTAVAGTFRAALVRQGRPSTLPTKTAKRMSKVNAQLLVHGVSS